MKNLLKLIPATVLFLASCQNAPETETDHSPHTTTEVVSNEAATSHEGHSTDVLLDNGKKWKANIETVDGIKKMQSIIENGKSSKVAANSLYTPLKNEFQTIFDKCTMTGAAHDQLHNFLMPIKDNLQNLEKNTDADQSLAAIDARLASFENYFE